MTTKSNKFNAWAPTAEERAAATRGRPHIYHVNLEEWCSLTGRCGTAFRKECERVAAGMPGRRIPNMVIASHIVLDEARFRDEEIMLARLDAALLDARRRAEMA